MSARRLPAAAGLLAGALLLSGCGSAGLDVAHHATAAEAGTGSGSVGALRVDGAYIPQEASPDVAAAYLQVTDTGDRADTLESADSPDARSVQLHETVGQGGADAMVPLADLPVPAHGTVVLAVGARHLMLMAPTHSLVKGDVVPLTLHFAAAGTLTLAVPVVGFTGPAG